jgi:hypothetical protein
VAILVAVLVVLRWDDANKVAVGVSALAAVAAVGVGVWAALPGSSSRGRIRVSRTGDAVAGRAGRANTGVIGKGQGDIRVDKTGNASGGDANTGVRLD